MKGDVHRRDDRLEQPRGGSEFVDFVSVAPNFLTNYFTCHHSDLSLFLHLVFSFKLSTHYRKGIEGDGPWRQVRLERPWGASEISDLISASPKFLTNSGYPTVLSSHTLSFHSSF